MDQADSFSQQLMKTTELEKYIKTLAPEIYSFAYALIPLDIQASQLIVDAVNALMIKNYYIVEKWKKAENLHFESETLDVKTHLYRNVFEIAKQRAFLRQQDKENMEIDGNDEFYQLNFNERAALYLKEKTDFSLKLIEFIMDVNRIEILAHLYSGRHHLTGVSSEDLRDI